MEYMKTDMLLNFHIITYLEKTKEPPTSPATSMGTGKNNNENNIKQHNKENKNEQHGTKACWDVKEDTFPQYKICCEYFLPNPANTQTIKINARAANTNPVNEKP